MVGGGEGSKGSRYPVLFLDVFIFFFGFTLRPLPLLISLSISLSLSYTRSLLSHYQTLASLALKLLSINIEFVARWWMCAWMRARMHLPYTIGLMFEKVVVVIIVEYLIKMLILS